MLFSPSCPWNSEPSHRTDGTGLWPIESITYPNSMIEIVMINRPMISRMIFSLRDCSFFLKKATFLWFARTERHCLNAPTLYSPSLRLPQSYPTPKSIYTPSIGLCGRFYKHSLHRALWPNPHTLHPSDFVVHSINTFTLTLCVQLKVCTLYWFR